MSAPDRTSPSLLEAKLHQIGAELAVLTPGSDEGLIPLVALSNDVLETENLPEEWFRPMERLQSLLDDFLETGAPIDKAGHRHLTAFSVWLDEALDRLLLGEALPPLPSVELSADPEPARVVDCPIEKPVRQILAEMDQLCVGSDEGLIPLFALSTDLLDSPDLPEVWSSALEALQALLEIYLDEGQPIDETGLERFAPLKEWISTAIANEHSGQIIVPWPGSDGTSIEELAGIEPLTANTGLAPMTHPVVSADEEILVVDTGSDTSLLREFFHEAMEHLESIEGYLLTLEGKPQDPEGLAAVFRAFHTVKGVSGFLELKPVQRLAHQVESLLDLARNDEIILNSQLFTLILESCDQLKAMTNRVGVALEKGSVENSSYPVADLVQRIEEAILTARSGDIEIAVSAPTDLCAPAVAAADSPTSSPTPIQAKARTIRVASERIDSLMDVVGELVILESQLAQSTKPFVGGNSDLQRQFSQFQRILKELQHTSMALQMVPIRPTFQRVERIVRDLSQKLNKKINLSVEGEETELDRTVIELITDPLVHMIRNAVDHGLETTEERIQAGKSEIGQIHLMAYHQGSSIVVELSDDGRGIDPEAIRAKAIERGIISPETALTREETLQLIFTPGFSTATTVTENSGRGVGMDVVKRNVETMRGVVSIQSELGNGSKFAVKLPLTTAIIDGLIVRIGTDKFIIPTHSVQVTMRPQKKQIVKIAGSREMVVLRDRTIPLVRLNRFLGIARGEEDPMRASLAIVESFGKQYAIMVDELINKQEVVIKNLGEVLGTLPGIAGGAILGDGSIALILDPAALAKYEAA